MLINLNFYQFEPLGTGSIDIIIKNIFFEKCI